nr:IS1182 family transposase [Ligilactobacillus murinus]
MATFYEPEKNHQAHYIHHLVESIDFDDSYTFGRPFEYEPRVLLKLVLLAYSYGIFSCRKIERFARENVVAMWLTQEAQPTYRTIARFVVSDTIEMMLKSSFSEFREYLRKNGLIDEAVFIDGTKILANANKYSFVWKKNTIRYDDLNRQKAKKLLKEIKESIVNIDFADDLTVDQLDEICARLEQRIEYLNEKVEETKKISPNPAKQERRTAKKYLKQTRERKQKNSKYAEQFAIVGERNSYSKTDNDATFMRMKEDPMKNGQTKPGYNLQVAANNQFALDYTLAPNPTDMRTLIPFLEKMDADVIQGPIVADAGYGSEPNYEFIEDKFGVFDYLIPYNTMLKEETKRWRSDERKVMNWHYNAEDDYYIDPKNVRFNFKRYAYRHDTYGYKRNFKVYEAEKFDEDRKENPNALTKKGNVRKIYINPQWEYFKGKVKTNLSNTEKNKIYRRRKYEIEPIFGNLKAYLGFTRFTVRSKKKVNRQMGIALMALNMWKMSTSSSKISPNNKNKKKTIRIFQNFQKIRMVFFKDRDLCHSLFAIYCHTLIALDIKHLCYNKAKKEGVYMSETISCRQTLAVTSHRVLASDLNEHETVYGGALLALLDGTASISASRFARSQCVTAALDQVNFIEPFVLNDSLCIESYVTGHGKRSLEVFVKVIGEHLDTSERFLGMTAFLTFVVLDKKVTLPELSAETPEEKSLCADFQKRKAYRRQKIAEQKKLQASLSLDFPWYS